MSSQIIPTTKNDLFCEIDNTLNQGDLFYEGGDILNPIIGTKKYKLLEWEMNEPDYEWLCYFAKKVECEIEGTMEWIMDIMKNESDYKQSEIENGSFISLNLRRCGEYMRDGLDDELNFYKLKELKYIDCSYSSIINLDVSDNIKLKELNCSYNKLANLDVSNNIELRELYCIKNNLTELDVSSNAKLSLLYCHINKLAKLDLSNTIELKELDCSHNKLINLDVFNNTELKDLYCGHNELTLVDISNNIKIEILICIYNKITYIDISNNMKLYVFNCKNNRLLKKIFINREQRKSMWENRNFLDHEDYFTVLW